MKVSDSLLEQAIELVENQDSLVENLLEVMPGCGCSGCGLGCSGTVGMD